MPVLRSSKSKKLYEPLGSTSKKSVEKVSKQKTDIEKEYEKLVSGISVNDIKACLQSSPSEARFFGEICKTELNKLVKQRDDLDKRIRKQIEYCRQKETEAAKIVSKLCQETNKRVSMLKRHRVSKLTKLKNISPDEVKRVFEEAKKISTYLRMKKKRLLEEKAKLETQIQLAKDTVKFCNKFRTPRK